MVTSHLREGAAAAGALVLHLPRPALAAPAAGPARQCRGALDADARRAPDSRGRHRACRRDRARASSRRSTRRRCRVASRRSPGNGRATSRSSCAAGWQRTPRPCRKSAADCRACSRSPAPRSGTSRPVARPRSSRSRSGSELSAEVFKLLGPEEIDELVLEIAALDNVVRRGEAGRPRGVLGDRPGPELHRAGRHRVRQGRPRARARRREGARDHGPPVELHPAVARSSSCAASTRSRSTTSCRTSTRRRRARAGYLPRRVGGDGDVDVLAGAAGRGRDAHRRDGPHRARGDPRGRAGDGAQALRRHQPGARRGRRRQVARRHPELRRPRDRARRSSTRSTSATRSSARTCAS